MADETQNIIVRVLTESELNELNNELNKTQKELSEMAIAGKEGTAEFDALNKKAEKLRGELKANSKATNELTQAQNKNTESTKEETKETEKATEKKKSLKAELRQLKAEMAALADAGEADSDAFRMMSLRAGELQDTISDTGGQIRALASDTRALDTGTEAIGLLVNGFAAAQSVIGIFSEDNEALAKAFQKAQLAMTLMASATAIVNALQKESILITNLQTYATQAYTYVTEAATLKTKLFRAALITTGVGALVVGLGFLIAKFIESNAEQTLAEKKAKALADANDKLDKTYADLNDSLDRNIKNMKAQGASQEEIDAQMIANSKKRIAQANKDLLALKSILEKNVEERIKSEAKGDKLLEDSLKYGEKLTNEYLKQEALKYKDAINKLTDEKLDAEITISEIEKAQQEKRKTNAEKHASERKTIEERYAQMMLESQRNVELMLMTGLAKELKIIDNSFEDKLKQAKGNESLITQIQNEQRQARLLKIEQWNESELKANEDKCNQEIQQEKAKEKSIEQVYLDAYYKRIAAVKSLRDYETNSLADERLKSQKIYKDKLEDLKDAKREELFSIIESDGYKAANESQQREILNAINQSYNDKEKLLNQQHSSDLVRITLDEKDAKLKIQEFYGKALNDTLTGIAQMIEGFGKADAESQKRNFERTKKFSIALALIDTYLAAQRAYLSQMQLDPSAPIRATIAAAAAVIAGLGRVAMIKKQTFDSPSSGGGGSGGGGGIGGSGSMPANTALRPNTTMLDANGRPIATGGNQNPPPLRAIVVENDIRTTSRRLNTIAENSRL